MTPDDSAATAALRDEIARLGPWHLDVQITEDLSTGAAREQEGEAGATDQPPVPFQRPRNAFLRKLRLLYPDGLQDRSFLECACNCGGYSFWAKEAGAGECFAFDVREHWIRQAEFIRKNRTVGPTDRMRFEVCDLYGLPELGLGPFDVSLFNGIFYHLPTPVAVLKTVADMTRELIVVNTATASDLPDGMLAVGHESREQLMSGVHDLMWRPTGPRVMAEILEWAGFVETRLVWWKNRTGQPGWGRLEIMGSKRAGLLDALEGFRPAGTGFTYPA